MLWNPALLTLRGHKVTVSVTAPALASPTFGFDLSERSQLFSDTAGTTQAADGALVARINDVFGGTSYFQQATSTARPTLVANAVGARAALRFPANGKWMSMASTVAGTTEFGLPFRGKTYTILCVYRRTSAAKLAGIFAAGNSTGGASNAGYDAIRLEGTSGGWPILWRNSGSEQKSFQLTSPTYADNQITKVVLRSDIVGNPTEIRAKSASGSFSGTGSNPVNADSFAWDVALLGSRIGSAGVYFPLDTFLGDICEFRRWGSRASDANFLALQDYADAKWGS